MDTENNDALANAAGIYVTTTTKNEKDEYHDLLKMLEQVNSFEPRENWILPIMRSNQCSDFRNQLLLAIEDHGEKQK